MLNLNIEQLKHIFESGYEKGEKDGGFMSKYGKKNEFESYAEGFADFYLSKGNSKNPVTQSLAKEFKWK